MGSKEVSYVKRKINVPPYLGKHFDGMPGTKQHFSLKGYDNKNKNRSSPTSKAWGRRLIFSY
jgi:hypothetical protein